MAGPQYASLSPSRASCYKKLEPDEQSLWKECDDMDSTTGISPLAGCFASMFSCGPRKVEGLGGMRQSTRQTTTNTVTRRVVTPTKDALHSSTNKSSPNRVVYHSPDSIKLKVPSAPETPPPSSSFCKSPQRVLAAMLRQQAPVITPGKCDFDSTNKNVVQRRCLVHPEHEDDSVSTGDRQRRLDYGYALRISNHDVFTDGRQQPELSEKIQECGNQWRNEGSRNQMAVRLTLGTLQQHEHVARESCVPSYSGDKLARSVIQRKTHWQLAKERKELSKPEACHHVAQEQPEGRAWDKPTVSKQSRWLDCEREKTLAAKWQRKKNESKERLRLEQMRIGELERQRKFRHAEQRYRVEI